MGQKTCMGTLSGEPRMALNRGLLGTLWTLLPGQVELED